MNVLYDNKKQKRLQYFFLIYCKNFMHFLFWVLFMCLDTFINNDNPSSKRFDV